MIKIDSLDHYGRGITKIDNKITFVENALPEEIIEVKIDKEKSKYIEGSVLKYIEKSKQRVNVDCPYYNSCGGCNIMHLSYQDQLKFKQEKIENIINKYLKEDIKINNIVSCDLNKNYRNKVTFQVKENIGFYKNNTYEIINIDSCLISDNLINKSISYLKKLNLKDINKITCRTVSNKLMVIIETKNNNLDITPLTEIADSIYFKIDNKYIHKYGDKYIYENLDNYKFKISPDSFFQVNINTCLKLYNKIKEYVGKNKNIIDLYCGTGSIGIFVNENNNVIGIEINEQASKDAIENKQINNLNNINFICGDSGKKLKELYFKPDIIIVDPPRSGLNKETIDNILKFNPKEIIYVSCDPMTLVRDLNILKDNYNIEEITPFDMFPNTYHVECLVYLKKYM
ncbi:MAG: class I SAM-dependent RNA methyltransferase [Firmicutes bacterium]|nr:class I SAM-dependent RNA methyltransferase [Bacillota bacterium]